MVKASSHDEQSSDPAAVISDRLAARIKALREASSKHKAAIQSIRQTPAPVTLGDVRISRQQQEQLDDDAVDVDPSSSKQQQDSGPSTETPATVVAEPQPTTDEPGSRMSAAVEEELLKLEKEQVKEKEQEPEVPLQLQLEQEPEVPLQLQAETSTPADTTDADISEATARQAGETSTSGRYARLLKKPTHMPGRR